MTAHATVAVSEGSLRVLLANCYPEAGPLLIDLTLNDRPLDTLRCAHREEAIVAVTEGLLRLQASTLYTTKVNGAVVDVGAWLQIWCGDNRLV